MTICSCVVFLFEQCFQWWILEKPLESPGTSKNESRTPARRPSLLFGCDADISEDMIGQWAGRRRGLSDGGFVQ